MIDTLVEKLPRASRRFPVLQRELGFGDDFILVTLHRPSNVDFEARLQEIMNAFITLSKEIPVVFLVHPRIREALNGLRLNDVGRIQYFVTCFSPSNPRTKSLTDENISHNA